jgi:hypothetical protein
MKPIYISVEVWLFNGLYAMTNLVNYLQVCSEIEKNIWGQNCSAN